MVNKMDWTHKLAEFKLIPSDGVEFSPLKDEEIRQIEVFIKTRLPDPYRWFLSQFGASEFEQVCPFFFN